VNLKLIRASVRVFGRVVKLIVSTVCCCAPRRMLICVLFRLFDACAAMTNI
jgi:hypothetical protein